MKEKQIAEFYLSEDTDTKILIEVEEPEIDSAVERVALPSGQSVLRASQSFEEAMERVKPMASTIISKLKDISNPADEVEVKFGLKLTADAGAVFTSIGGEVNYEITLKWTHNK